MHLIEIMYFSVPYIRSSKEGDFVPQLFTYKENNRDGNFKELNEVTNKVTNKVTMFGSLRPIM